METKIVNLQASGNGKAAIICKEWLDKIFGNLNYDELLKKYLYINYDDKNKVLYFSKEIENEYFGKKKKIINIGKSFGIYIDIRIVRHIFADVYKINYKSRDLKVETTFYEDENKIKIIKKDDDNG
jgi:hypothetical protein